MPLDKRIYEERLTREVPISRAAIDEDYRTVELAFSSEEPVERWFGLEVLDHRSAAVDLSRLESGAALLVNHDSNQHVGVVENARVDKDKRGRATVRFGKSDMANEVFQDVRDGIRSLVSVGYQILETEIERAEVDKKTGEPVEPDTVRITKWQPMEISIVSVPADASVGVGRSAEPKPEVPAERKQKTMSEENTSATQAQPEIDIQVVREEATKAERARQTEIRKAAQRMSRFDKGLIKHGEAAIAEGMSSEEFAKRIPSLIEEQEKITKDSPDPDQHRNLGMSRKELEAYSFVRAINEASKGGVTGLEKEVSDQYAKHLRQEPGSFFVPPDVMRGNGQRDLLTDTATAGGNLVATNLLAGSFIDLLRNRMVIAQLGTRFLTGLVGDVVIPRQSGGVSADWQGSEEASQTEGNATFDQVTLTPMTLHARQDMSKQLIAQSTPGVEQLVREDLATGVAIALDLAAINGSGSSGEPEGILNTTGIGSVVFGNGTNGGAPVWADIVEFESQVAIDNADMGSLAYLVNAATRGKLKSTSLGDTSTGRFIWGQGDTTLNGYRAAVSNQVPSNLTAGTDTTVASAMIFGNFSDLLVGQWGGLDVLVNPYTQASLRIVEVHTSMFADVDVRHAESFAAASDLLTT